MFYRIYILIDYFLYNIFHKLNLMHLLFGKMNKEFVRLFCNYIKNIIDKKIWGGIIVYGGIHMDKTRDKYSFFSNLFFLIKNWFKKDTFGAIVVFLSAIISVIIPMVDAFITRTVANSIIESAEISFFIRELSVLFCVYIVLKFINVWAEERTWFFQNKVSMLYGVNLMDAVMDKELADFESTKGRSLFERAKSFAFDGDQADGAWSAIRFSKLLTSFVGFLTYTIIFSKVSFVLIAIVILTSFIAYFLQYKLTEFGNVTADEMSLEEMRLYYLYRIAGESRAQREVRILNAFGMVYSYLAKFSNAYYSILRKYTKKANTSTELQAVLGFVRDFFTYYILAKNAALGKISTGDFIFYLTLVVGFSEWLNNFTGHIMSLKRISIGCGKYREFVDEKNDEDKKPDIDVINDIELKNLSFQYDEDSKILKNINLSMKRGDSVAIVGENGAGKTTLIKVLAGLYKPTAGEIYVNGENLNDFSSESIYKRTSILFQDYFMLPGTLLENMDNKVLDEKKATEFVEKLGLKDRIDGLTDGLQSEVIDVENNKIEGFSGGELQRILLIKSLMKESDILILDEPTAALDPISEEKLYNEYKDFSRDKISIFISHRITSTRFCDRIIYLENGEIAEYGTYEELMKLDGKYKKMFDLQAKYYKEDENEDD